VRAALVAASRLISQGFLLFGQQRLEPAPASVTTDLCIWHKRMNFLKKAFAFARLFG
jgi:hypothetical protein